MKITVLGTRGSMPVAGKSFVLYGGATSCYKVQAGDEEIYLDAGSGIVEAMSSPTTRVTILITHMHLDHILGLPFFSTLRESGRPIDIYAGKRSGLLPHEAIDRLISPPFWPCKIENYPAHVNIHTLPELSRGNRTHFNIGAVEVDMMEGNHPGGSTIFRLTYAGKSLVYATDFEHTPEDCAALTDFAKRTNLLLYDAQYTEDEYGRCRGYGHSTPAEGLKVAAAAEVGRLLFVHHAPNRTDEELLNMEREFAGRAVSFAKFGEEIFLR